VLARAKPPVLVGALLAALLPLNASADVSVSPLDCAGPNACRIVFIYQFVFWIAMGVLVVVGGLIVYAALRYRRRDEREPPQVHSYGPLEMAWTVVPFLILIFLFGLSFANMTYLKKGPAEQGMTITVIGEQFAWQFIYPDPKVTASETLRVPEGEVIRLKVTSKDVLHSWWIPRLGGQIYAVPGRDNEGWFQANRTGKAVTYLGQCNELCGIGHANMQGKVIAMPRAEFDKWYRDKQAGGS